jgi:dTDP-4-amino-4,6-dideoxygalactose transaminase
MKVPFLDMQASHAPHREEFLAAIAEVIDSGCFSGGPFVERFETDFARYCGTRHAIGLGSGTEALWLSLVAMGIGPGDEVVTVPMTFAATVEAICLAGATPVFVDIDERTYTMDPAVLEKVLTPRTKAVMPVHLFGQIAEMDPILEIAREFGLRVIEDAAQAHGADHRGRKAGALGHAGCFSFYPAKNLGAFGQGGAVTTADDTLARKLRLLRNHGQYSKNRHTIVGWNSRLDSIQAAVLGIKLKHLDEDNRKRREHAAFYHRELSNLPNLVTPSRKYERQHVYQIYPVQAYKRTELVRIFEKRQIGFGFHYPVPIHQQAAYLRLGYKTGDFPVSEQCAERFISLPMYPGLTPAQLAYVTDAVKESAGVCTTV